MLLLQLDHLGPQRNEKNKIRKAWEKLKIKIMGKMCDEENEL